MMEQGVLTTLNLVVTMNSYPINICLVNTRVDKIIGVTVLLTLQCIKVREYRSGNQEWTIQINWPHWVHKTKDKDKQSKTHNTEN